ncbi:MAG: flagellar motor protein [Planctomycetes bacterium]|nr:flagellar motor protein [Planctomycetota bacterium]
MKPDGMTFGGLLIAAVAVLGGQALEGGHIGSIMQPTAALIVLGGTLGAVMISYTPTEIFGSIKAIKHVFFQEAHDAETLVQELLAFAKKARKDGLISLESDAEEATDPFLEKALWLAVDGTPPDLVRETLETLITTEEESGHRVAKVWETAGGYAPTVGILGAVLGLIHVMENLDDPTALGPGIAVAFVATIYGVGIANILFLPMANKLKLVDGLETRRREMVLAAVLAILSGDNVRLVEEKVRAILPLGSTPEKATPATA